MSTLTDRASRYVKKHGHPRLEILLGCYDNAETMFRLLIGTTVGRSWYGTLRLIQKAIEEDIKLELRLMEKIDG